MVGTGVFVSVGIAADVAGPGVLVAVVAAGLLAAANGLSSAQLAAAHPVSGGTYEYGHLRLSPGWGFSAGFMFMLAKSASAATAALGLAGYLLDVAGLASPLARGGLAAASALALTAFVAGGIRRSNRGNAVVVAVTLAGLATLVVTAVPTVLDAGFARFTPLLGGGVGGPVGRGSGGVSGRGGVAALLHGSALMFVAFTGYGRIATLGEEVRDPARVIPRAIGVTVTSVVLLYLAVAAVGVGVLGADAFGRAAVEEAAPLQAVARALPTAWLPGVVAVAAATAMTGVLLNLILGLSRVLLAMARRGDAPAILARIDPHRRSPVSAVWACGLFVTALTLPGDVRTTWSFSAFTVLVYYAITNLAALALPPEQRRFPRWIAVAGLTGCLGLAFWVEPRFWLTGLALLAAGHTVRRVVRTRTGDDGASGPRGRDAPGPGRD
jgi:APA family basic amino acid/polyamine antiporter